MPKTSRLYWLKRKGTRWKQVSRSTFKEAEEEAGYRPTDGKGLATAGFVRGKEMYAVITDQASDIPQYSSEANLHRNLRRAYMPKNKQKRPPDAQ